MVNPRLPVRPAITFIPASTDPERIRFFGALFPGLLLLKEAPGHLVAGWARRRVTPRESVESLIRAGSDDLGSVGDTWVFVHRWEGLHFDPVAFADAKTFLRRLTRKVRAEGFLAEPLDPLSPERNLPQLAASAGLGNLSPFGLLVHPRFGPRLIITALRTNHPFRPPAVRALEGCRDCMACVLLCPQKPADTGVVNLGQCQRCAKCLEVCPTGKATRAVKAGSVTVPTPTSLR